MYKNEKYYGIAIILPCNTVGTMTIAMPKDKRYGCGGRISRSCKGLAIIKIVSLVRNLHKDGDDSKQSHDIDLYSEGIALSSHK